MLHRDRRLVAELALERLGQVPVLGPEDLVDPLVEELGHRARPLGERGLDLARGLLELRPYEVGVGLGLLAVEHAGADLDRVDQHAAPGPRPPSARARTSSTAARSSHGQAVDDARVGEDG